MDNKFDTDNYYGKSNESNGYYGNNNGYYGNSSKSNSSYDDVFNSYSDDNSKLNKNKKKKEKKSSNNNGTGSWKKIVIVILLAIIVAGVGVLAYMSRDKIKSFIDPDKDVSITVDVLDSNLSMVVGDTRKLNYKMTNSSDVSLLTFASSNNSVAKVDKEGNIKAVGAGQAIISVSYMGEKGKVTKTCYLSITNVSGASPTSTPLITQEQVNQMKQDSIEESKKTAEEKAREAARKAAETAAKNAAEANKNRNK